ncbi:DUF6624 domain-containing protein [Pedobacter nototheniae]|uniref:DUF6624 domain-containing protein n=1 Tax=Pedobacter nototheniae TaxID=2488994 RepID=UPI002930656B|nr:DUF6624 domain-containing protein [Pedobacter nototheniae]
MKHSLLAVILLMISPYLFAQIADKKEIIKQLDSIGALDQAYRNQLESIRQKHAGDSIKLRSELKNKFRLIRETDSTNLIKVAAIISKYGWLSSEEIGEAGNSAMFMVIQHADLKAQEKYLPMLRLASKEQKLKATHLALIEDRVAMFNGKKQIYGSQLAWNITANKFTIMPMVDPDHIDERRASIGLPPYAAYLSDMNMVWDVEQYKKDLPAIELWHKEIMKKVKP